MRKGFEQPNAFHGEERNHHNNDDNDDIEAHQHDNSIQNDDIQSSRTSRTTKEIISYAIPLTRRNVTRIPNATPIRWNQQDPPAAEPEKPIPLPKIATPMCVTGSLVVTLLAWSLMAAVTFAYGYVLWNLVLFFFEEGAFYEMAENNKTTIVVN
jgi:hypothetical protein